MAHASVLLGIATTCCRCGRPQLEPYFVRAPRGSSLYRSTRSYQAKSLCSCTRGSSALSWKEVRVLCSEVALQRHIDYVRRGYAWYVTGMVPPEKVRRLQAKFVARYNVNEHRNVRARRRRTGEAAAVLLFYVVPCGLTSPGAPDGQQLTVGWSLLLTDGEHKARSEERHLRDAREHRTRLRIGPYILTRRTRPGQSTPSWTWMMTREEFAAWRERVIRSARGDIGDRVTVVLSELYRVPGFAGIRSQVGHIVSLYRREWRRRRRRGDAFPCLPKLRYVQRLANDYVTVALPNAT